MSEALVERTDPEFHESLRRCREAQGLSILDLAEALNLPTITVRRYERGDEIPNGTIHTALSAILDGQKSVSGEGFGRGMSTMMKHGKVGLAEISAATGITLFHLQQYESGESEPGDSEKSLILEFLKERQGVDLGIVDDDVLLREASYEQVLERLRQLGKESGLIED